VPALPPRQGGHSRARSPSLAANWEPAPFTAGPCRWAPSPARLPSGPPGGRQRPGQPHTT